MAKTDDQTRDTAYEWWLQEREEPHDFVPGPHSLVSLIYFAGGLYDKATADPPLTEEELAIVEDMEREAREFREQHGHGLVWMIPD